jgi:hypothetical protein
MLLLEFSNKDISIASAMTVRARLDAELGFVFSRG